METSTHRVEAYEAVYRTQTRMTWRVGVLDRGLGHRSYAVITEDEVLLVKCDHEIIAEHIVKVHNETLRQDSGHCSLQ